MGRKRRPSLGKKINPTYYVFCEGKTEDEYIKFLKSEFHVSISIVNKVAKSSICKASINNYKKGKPVHKKDKDFLLYDGDVPEVVERLKKINEAILLISYHCIELWFLLHIQDQNGCIPSKKCIEKLNNKIGYKKVSLDAKLCEVLTEEMEGAVARAKGLPEE